MTIMSGLEGTPTNDDASSTYSRFSHTPKLEQSTSGPGIPLPATHDLPEINSLDHQIALARGSTMALETTRARLRCAKPDRPLSLPEMREEKLQQWENQDRENRFYGECLAIFDELSTSVTCVSQTLALQHYFEPESSPVGNARVLEAVHKLREALENSRKREAQAENRWKRQLNVPRLGSPSSRWI
jgi:hypothetical protein